MPLTLGSNIPYGKNVLRHEEPQFDVIFLKLGKVNGNITHSGSGSEKSVAPTRISDPVDRGGRASGTVNKHMAGAASAALSQDVPTWGGGWGIPPRTLNMSGRLFETGYHHHSLRSQHQQSYLLVRPATPKVAFWGPLSVAATLWLLGVSSTRCMPISGSSYLEKVQ